MLVRQSTLRHGITNTSVSCESEFARKALRLEQENEEPMAAPPRDLVSLEAALEIALHAQASTEREADFNSPNNPRRLQLAIEKLNPPGTKPGSGDEPH